MQVVKKNPKKVKAGRLSQKKGEDFENLMRMRAAIVGYTAIRIPNGARRAGKFLIPIKSPFDYVFVRGREVIFCDLKTTSKKSFEHSAIKENQINNLYALENHGHPSGYIVRFEIDGVLVFFDASLLLRRSKIKGSLKPVDGIVLGDRERLDFGPLFNRTPSEQTC